VVGGRDLPSGENEILGHLDAASAAPVQEPRHMASLHLVLRGEIRRARAQKLGQILPRRLQSVRVIHQQLVMQVGPNFQRVLHTPNKKIPSPNNTQKQKIPQITHKQDLQH
jgi:hypothetical protein